MKPVAIIAGAGLLPELLANECRRLGRVYVVVQFQGIDLDWAGGHHTEVAEFERLDSLFDRLISAGCTAVVFAGAMARPRVDVTRLDATTRLYAPLRTCLKATEFWLKRRKIPCLTC
jgi:UDP-2,3-diacylglucosamine hydrolase